MAAGHHAKVAADQQVMEGLFTLGLRLLYDGTGELYGLQEAVDERWLYHQMMGIS